MERSIGVVIPTWQGVNHLPKCLPPLLQSPLKPRILVIDSSSTDGTPHLAASMGVEVVTIPKGSFNHGLTREWGRRYLATDIIVMMTQDAYPASSDLIERLIAPLLQKEAAAAYARQIPHVSAGLLGAFSRRFNYPSHSQIRRITDVPQLGAYTFFFSNSCGAYLNCALDEIGGFAEARFGEDAIAVAKLLHRGHQIAYVAEAVVRHSHDYTLKEEFSRHYEMGFSRRDHRQWLNNCKGENARGKAYAIALFKELWRAQPSLIPYAFLQTLIKYFGYRAGSFSSYFSKK